MPGYPPKKYANSYNPKEENKRYETRTDKKFETVGKLKLTEEQKAYNLQQLKKMKRKELLSQEKRKRKDD